MRGRNRCLRQAIGLGLKLTISINSTLEVLQALLDCPDNRTTLRDAGAREMCFSM